MQAKLSQTTQPNTLIAQLETDPDVVREAKTALARVHKVIADGGTDKNLNKVLLLANVALDEYT